MHHKECATDEMFVGNTARQGAFFPELKEKGMKTVRLGNIAYAIDGMPLPEYYAPVIIKRSEADLHNEIMMTKTFGPNWRRG
jgi:hypothetical protein